MKSMNPSPCCRMKWFQSSARQKLVLGTSAMSMTPLDGHHMQYLSLYLGFKHLRFQKASGARVFMGLLWSRLNSFCTLTRPSLVLNCFLNMLKLKTMFRFLIFNDPNIINYINSSHSGCSIAWKPWPIPMTCRSCLCAQAGIRRAWDKGVPKKGTTKPQFGMVSDWVYLCLPRRLVKTSKPWTRVGHNVGALEIWVNFRS